jgi:hypothetical protein
MLRYALLLACLGLGTAQAATFSVTLGARAGSRAAHRPAAAAFVGGSQQGTAIPDPGRYGQSAGVRHRCERLGKAAVRWSSTRKR